MEDDRVRSNEELLAQASCRALGCHGGPRCYDLTVGTRPSTSLCRCWYTISRRGLLCACPVLPLRLLRLSRLWILSWRRFHRRHFWPAPSPLLPPLAMTIRKPENRPALRRAALLSARASCRREMRLSGNPLDKQIRRPPQAGTQRQAIEIPRFSRSRERRTKGTALTHWELDYTLEKSGGRRSEWAASSRRRPGAGRDLSCCKLQE